MKSATDFPIADGPGRALLPAPPLWRNSSPQRFPDCASLSHGGPQYTAYGGIIARLQAMLALVSFNEPTALFDLALLAASLLFLAIAWRSRALVFAPTMRFPIAAILIAAVLMPEWVSGSWAAQIRLPAILPFILIASTQFQGPRRPFIAVFSAVALVFLAARVWTVSVSWHEMDRRFAEFLAISRDLPEGDLPEGARLLTVMAPMPDGVERTEGIPRAMEVQTPKRY